ncbi:MAG: GIN domain-containing protein, partial [Sphingomicrobium sp.]
MRTFLAAAATTLALAALAAPAGAATRNFGITDFSKIRVDGPFKVTVATGVAPFARAVGSSAAIDRVAIEVRGDTLIVHSNASSWGGYPGTDAGPVEVSVGTHELSNAWLNGSGSLAIDRVKGLSFALSVQGSGAGEIGSVAVDQMSVSLVGSASAKLSGQAKKLTALVRGITTLDAAKLDVPAATLAAEGAATLDAVVTDAVKVDATGPATI